MDFCLAFVNFSNRGNHHILATFLGKNKEKKLSDEGKQRKIEINLKKILKNFADSKKFHTFALAIQKYGSVAQLNRASDYGSEGYRFESCRSH